jgi:hypothetical protein
MPFGLVYGTALILVHQTNTGFVSVFYLLLVMGIIPLAGVEVKRLIPASGTGESLPRIPK